MNIYLTRDSVAAGDDVDAPHGQTLVMPDCSNPEEIIKQIARMNYLPLISGGKASWSVVSCKPLAVIAQQWREAKMLFGIDSIENLAVKKDGYKFHINYHAQIDPEIVYKVLSKI